MRRSLAATTIALCLAAGCSNDPAAAPAAAPKPSPTPSAASSEPVDEYGERACALVEAAVDADNLTKNGIVEEIADAGIKSTNSYVANAAEFLPEQLELAIAAQGQDDEFAMRTGLLTAAIEMQTECIRGRLN